MADSISTDLINQAREIVSGSIELGELESISEEHIDALRDIIAEITVSADGISSESDNENAESIIYCLKALRLCNEEVTRASSNNPDITSSATHFSSEIQSLMDKLERNSVNIVKKKGRDWVPVENPTINKATGSVNSAKEACGFANQHLTKNSRFTSGFGDRLASAAERLFSGSSLHDTAWGEFKTKPAIERKASMNKAVLSVPTLSFNEFEESKQQNQSLVLMTRAVSQVSSALASLGANFNSDDLSKANERILGNMPSAKGMLEVIDTDSSSNKEVFSIHDYISKCFDEAKDKLIKQKPSLKENIKALFDSIKTMFSALLTKKSGPSLGMSAG